MLFAPRQRRFEVGPDVGLGAHVARPSDARLLLLVHPGCALMGEVEWVVVVKADDQVAVVRQHELGQAAKRTPLDGVDHDRSRRVVLAHDGERVRDQLVVLLSRQGAVGFVQQLEVQALGMIGIVFGDLLPEADEAIAMGVGLLGDAIVVVNIDQREQARVESAGHRPVDPREKLGVDGVRRCL